MKCVHCGSEWNSNTAVSECPFCKKPLNQASNAPKSLKSVLVQLRDQFGVQNFGNGKALISSFKDLAPELKKEQTMLTYLERCDGIKELYQAKDKSRQEQELVASKVIRHMVDDLMVSEAAAQTVCNTYMQVLTGREKVAQQEDNSPDALAEYRAKLTQKLREQDSEQKEPKPKCTVPPAGISRISNEQNQTASSGTEFVIDASGTLVKYTGKAASVTVPANVRVIGEKAFERNQYIEQVWLPEGLQSIQNEAFAVCPKLRSIPFPNTLRSIGEKAFWACNMITEVSLPANVINIAPLVFWGCKGMKKVTLQAGFTSLGRDVFNSCSGITEIHLPQSLTTVHPNAFAGAMNARVYGNAMWIVKDGHVVRAVQNDTTYHNKGINEKTVVVDAPNGNAPKQTAVNNRAYKNEQPPVSAPKPPVTPSRPQVSNPTPPPTAPKPPVTPQKVTKVDRDIELVTNMWLWIAVAVIMFLISFSEMGYPKELYGVLPMFAIVYWMGRALLKKGRSGLAVICFLAASIFITMFNTVMPLPTWVSVLIGISCIILLTLSGLVYKR